MDARGSMSSGTDGRATMLEAAVAAVGGRLRMKTITFSGLIPLTGTRSLVFIVPIFT